MCHCIHADELLYSLTMYLTGKEEKKTPEEISMNYAQLYKLNRFVSIRSCFVFSLVSILAFW